MQKLSKITEYLYLGDVKDASRKKLLLDSGIKKIVCAAVKCPQYFKEHFDYLSLELYDDNLQYILPDMIKTIEYIQTSVNENKSVLVHC